MAIECKKRDLAVDTIRRTLQNGPPADEEPISYRGLVVRPEDIALLLTGLDQQEFRQALRGMFVCFDVGNVLSSGYSISSLSGGPAMNMRGRWALPISDVTFERNVSQHSLPFLPAHLRSNALLHIDPQLVIVRNGTNRIVDFPIPQSRELIKRSYPWQRMSQLNYRPLSQESIKSKIHEFWQALKKAKSVPFNSQKSTVLPVPELPKQ